MCYNIYNIKYIKKGENKVSWELINSNPDYEYNIMDDIFRLDELYDDNKDKTFEYTDIELQVINMLLKDAGVL